LDLDPDRLAPGLAVAAARARTSNRELLLDAQILTRPVGASFG
jgi:hypothetical protein